MTRILAVFAAVATVVFLATVGGFDCATTGPRPPLSCAEDPNQLGCPGGLSDGYQPIDINARRGDAGR